MSAQLSVFFFAVCHHHQLVAQNTSIVRPLSSLSLLCNVGAICFEVLYIHQTGVIKLSEDRGKPISPSTMEVRLRWQITSRWCLRARTVCPLGRVSSSSSSAAVRPPWTRIYSMYAYTCTALILLRRPIHVAQIYWSKHLSMHPGRDRRVVFRKTRAVLSQSSFSSEFRIFLLFPLEWNVLSSLFSSQNSQLLRLKRKFDGLNRYNVQSTISNALEKSTICLQLNYVKWFREIYMSTAHVFMRFD